MAGLVIAGQASAYGQIPSPPEVSLKSYILMDAASGEVLASQSPDEPMHPASLTKMMTAYLAEMEMAAGNINRDDKVLVSEKSMEPGRFHHVY